MTKHTVTELAIPALQDSSSAGDFHLATRESFCSAAIVVPTFAITVPLRAGLNDRRIKSMATGVHHYTVNSTQYLHSIPAFFYLPTRRLAAVKQR
jgi:hypothetical protein